MWLGPDLFPVLNGDIVEMTGILSRSLGRPVREKHLMESFYDLFSWKLLAGLFESKLAVLVVSLTRTSFFLTTSIYRALIGAGPLLSLPISRWTTICHLSVLQGYVSPIQSAFDLFR